MAALKHRSFSALVAPPNKVRAFSREYEWYRGSFRLIAMAVGRFLFVTRSLVSQKNFLSSDRRKKNMAKDYTSTLNLPTTEFPMRANLPQREPDMLKYWESIDLYNAMLEKNKDKKPQDRIHDRL